VIFLKNGKEIEFVCPLCGVKEMIPTGIVEMLDGADQVGVDNTVPPRFDCEKCEGKMEPTYYVGVNGKIYERK